MLRSFIPMRRRIPRPRLCRTLKRHLRIPRSPNQLRQIRRAKARRSRVLGCRIKIRSSSRTRTKSRSTQNTGPTDGPLPAVPVGPATRFILPIITITRRLIPRHLWYTRSPPLRRHLRRRRNRQIAPRIRRRPQSRRSTQMGDARFVSRQAARGLRAPVSLTAR